MCRRPGGAARTNGAYLLRLREERKLSSGQPLRNFLSSSSLPPASATVNKITIACDITPLAMLLTTFRNFRSHFALRSVRAGCRQLGLCDAGRRTASIQCKLPFLVCVYCAMLSRSRSSEEKRRRTEQSLTSLLPKPVYNASKSKARRKLFTGATLQGVRTTSADDERCALGWIAFSRGKISSPTLEVVARSSAR